MKVRLAGGFLITFGSIAAAYAQVPDDLLKPNEGGEIKPFYQGEKDGAAVLWASVASAKGDGYGCGVTFMSPNGIVSIHGPSDQSDGAADRGIFTFGGNSIPSVRKPRMAQVAVRSGGKEIPLTALHIGSEKNRSMLRLPINIWQTVNEKNDIDEYEVTMDGRKVVQIEVIELQRAYKQLKKCMAPLGKSR